MAPEVPRPRHCLGGSLPSTPLPSPLPGKPGRSTSTSAPCRRPSSPPPPSSKPSRGNHKSGRRNRPAPAWSDRPGVGPESRSPVVAKPPVKRLVMEEITLLRRGEVVKAPPAAEGGRPEEAPVGGGDLALCSTDRLGPDPEILPKQTNLVGGEPSFYAGSCFVASPSPSSLPFPASLFAKKDGGNKIDLATKGLRYLLRLDLP